LRRRRLAQQREIFSQRQRVAGLDGQRIAITTQRALAVAQVFQGLAQPQPAVEVRGIQSQGFTEMLLGAFQFAVQAELRREPALRLRQRGIVAGRALETFHGVFELLRLHQQSTQLQVASRTRGIDDQRLLQCLEGFLVPAELAQHRAQVVPAIGMARLPCHRLVETTRGVVGFLQQRVYPPQVRPGARIARCQRGSALTGVHRLAVAAHQQQQRTEVPLRRGISRIACQRRFAQSQRLARRTAIERGIDGGQQRLRVQNLYSVRSR
jgi:hypothetical protein